VRSPCRLTQYVIFFVLHPRGFIMKNTFTATDTLRGVAILAVLVNHYLNMNVSGDYVGFASLWISIFFIVSGYGIQYSLTSSFKDSSPILKKIFLFYYNRATRILPLFIFALAGESLLRSNGRTIFMIPGIHYSGHYWFVLSILQCYIFAPFVYLSIKKNRLLTVYSIFVIFLVLTFLFRKNVFPSSIVNIMDILHSDYRNIYFFNILIYSLSMCLPSYIERWKEVDILEKKMLIFIAICFVLLGMISSKYSYSLQYIDDIMQHSFYPIVLLFFLTVFVIVNRISIRIFSFLGEISYPIYLFHGILYVWIDKHYGYGLNSLIELLVTLLFLLVPFLVVCFLIEKASKRLTLLLKI